MSMNVNQVYSQFYVGTEPLKSYGSDNGPVRKKDTVVKYEFKTVDEQGNKIMDKMTREEALRTMNEISAQYGDNVLVQFSGDGLDALAQSIKEQARKGEWKQLSEEEAAAVEKRNADFQKEIVHLENTHRLFIPNIETHEMLYGSLENADEKAVRAANGIIKNYFLPGSVEGMSNAQRQDMIAFGMEEAKYLARNYLDEEHAKGFLSAMENIARFGMNGVMGKDGKMTYHIEMGPIIGSSDEQERNRAIIKEKAPELYREIEELHQKIAGGDHKEKLGTKFLELQKKAQKVLEAEGVRKPDYEESVANYEIWKKEIAKTELPKTFQGVKYDDLSLFFESMKGQSSLSDFWMEGTMARFLKWLEI